MEIPRPPELGSFLRFLHRTPSFQKPSQRVFLAPNSRPLPGNRKSAVVNGCKRKIEWINRHQHQHQQQYHLIIRNFWYTLFTSRLGLGFALFPSPSPSSPTTTFLFFFGFFGSSFFFLFSWGLMGPTGSAGPTWPTRPTGSTGPTRFFGSSFFFLFSWWGRIDTKFKHKQRWQQKLQGPVANDAS